MSIGSISVTPRPAEPQAKLPPTAAGTQAQQPHRHHGGGHGESALVAASLTSSGTTPVLDTLV